jgi:hypothetical protein
MGDGGVPFLLFFKTRILIVHLHCLLLSGRFPRGKIQATLTADSAAGSGQAAVSAGIEALQGAEPALCGQLEL